MITKHFVHQEQPFQIELWPAEVLPELIKKSLLQFIDETLPHGCKMIRLFQQGLQNPDNILGHVVNLKELRAIGYMMINHQTGDFHSIHSGREHQHLMSQAISLAALGTTLKTTQPSESQDAGYQEPLITPACYSF